MADFQSRENRALAYEIKALIPVEQAREVRAWARARMQPDPNAESGAGDIYRITAPIIGECVERALASRVRVYGVVSAAEAFDAQDMLRQVTRHGLTVSFS